MINFERKKNENEKFQKERGSFSGVNINNCFFFPSSKVKKKMCDTRHVIYYIFILK